MRLHCRTAAIAAAVLMVAGTSARADLLIQIDKNTQQMTVSADGKPLYTWPVSTGRKKYNTPNGEFKPLGMDRHHFSREWDYAPMPYSIFFTEDGHAIHGTNEQRALGRAVSHGCVRLSVKHAAMLWDLVKKEGKANTKVVLTGELPKAPAVARAKPKRQLADAPARGRLPSHQRRVERSSYHARQRVYPASRYDYGYARSYRGRPYFSAGELTPPPPPFGLFMTPGR
jgi:hypothetical protein